MITEPFEVMSFSMPNDERVGFLPSAKQVFKEEGDIMPVLVPGKKSLKYIPWGVDNMMPYTMIDLTDTDETMQQCQRFRAEMLYAQGLKYCTDEATEAIRKEVMSLQDFTDFPEYWMGVCSDMAFFDFAITVITLSPLRDKVLRISRREAMHCRFSPIAGGYSRYVIYANWKNYTPDDTPEVIPVLNPYRPLEDLQERIADKANKVFSFAIVTRYPNSNPSYYPIPSYASLFKSKWYDIKRLTALAKYNKLKNAAPLKYLVEIENGFWDKHMEAKGITGKDAIRAEITRYKQQITEYLTGAENSGKSLFSGFYVDPTGHEVHDIKITNLEVGKSGGDWESDIQEAANIVCFAMGVHPNVVGAVPGKAQTNNSGSDKRELFTMSQARMKPYRDILFRPHNLVIRFNGWENVHPEVKIMQLTTLDTHQDSQTVKEEGAE